MKTTPVTVRLRLPEEMAERLQRCAAASDRPQAQMARWLLRNALDVYEAAVISGPIKDEDFAGCLATLKPEPADAPAN
jgi:hypothetical protein